MSHLDKGPVGQCRHCSADIYTEDYVYDGKVVCRECYEYAWSDRAAVDYAEAHPATIIQYLRECGVISEEAPVVTLLRDFRDWVKEDFDRWVMA